MNLSRVLLYVQYNELLSVQGLHDKLDVEDEAFMSQSAFPFHQVLKYLTCQY